MLPVLNIAKEKVTVPILEKQYTIRPYLVGEEKALFMAIESKDQSRLIEAVKNLIVACVEEKINIDDLSSFEIEYLFLQLRRMSVGEDIEIGISHKHNENCKHVQRVSLKIHDIQFKGSTENRVVLDPSANVGVLLRAPSLKSSMKKYNTEVEQIFGIVTNSIEAIYDSDSVYYTKDFSEKELNDWVNHLNNEQVGKILSFIGNLPSMYYDIKYVCESCGEVEEQTLEGLSNFL